MWLSDGVRYAPKRFREIVKERYLISKNCHTSYSDTKDITPTEREYILQFIIEDLQKQKDLIDKAKADADKKKASIKKPRR